MHALKSFCKQLLLSRGFEFKRIEDKQEPTPVYEQFDEACRQRNYGEPAAFLCPISKIVTVNGFSFLHRASWHPFVEALREYIASDCKQAYQGSLLERFYNNWQPENSLEALIGANGPTALSRYPAYAMHSPWLDIDPDERAVFMQRIIRVENRWFSGTGVDASEGYGLHGPVTLQKGNIEYQRLTRALRSIREHGYDRRLSGDDVTVVALEHNGGYRFCIAHGQHRVPVLAALGYQTIPVSITRVVRSREIVHWPQVYRGLWSPQQARDYLDHLFHFDARRWAVNRGLASPNLRWDESTVRHSTDGAMEAPCRLR